MPNQPLLLAALLVICACTATACYSPHVFAPPGRVAFLETAKPLGQDAQTVGVQAGRTIIDDFDHDHLSARYRYGFSEQLEIGVDANLARYSEMPSPRSRSNPYIGSGRIGAKWAPADLIGYVAFVGGIGAGAYDGGPFISPDLGVIFAFENRYIVPSLSITGFVSVPLDAQEIDLSFGRTSDFIHSATTTVGFMTTLGARVPIDFGTWTLAPSTGLGLGKISDDTASATSVTFIAGMDILF